MWYKKTEGRGVSTFRAIVRPTVRPPSDLPCRACFGISIIGLVLYVGVYFFLFGAAFYGKYRDRIETVGVVVIAILLVGGTIYKALFPLGYDKKREIWTGKFRKTEKQEKGE